MGGSLIDWIVQWLVQMCIRDRVYLALSESAGQAVQAPQSVPGYMGSDRIVDAASARYELQLPGTGGRDGYDISIREENGDTYMTAGATLYLAQELSLIHIFSS